MSPTVSNSAVVAQPSPATDSQCSSTKALKTTSCTPLISMPIRPIREVATMAASEGAGPL